MQEKIIQKPKNPGGRPPIPLDERQIEELSKIQCTMKEIACVMGVCEDTIEKRYSGKIKEWREAGKPSLRKWMWDAAKKGNVTMQIWLSKQHLGMREPEPSENKEIAKGAFNLWWDEINKKKDLNDKSK